MRKKLLGFISMLLTFGLTVGASGCDMSPVTKYLPDSLKELLNVETPDKGSDGEQGDQDGEQDGDETPETPEKPEIPEEPETPEEPEIPDEPETPVIVTWKEGNGISFDKNDVIYQTATPFAEMPYTYEAWIQVPTSVEGNAGVIYSNYTDYSFSAYTKIEIGAGGVPSISINGTSATFNSVDVRSDEFVHLAICLDKNQNKAKCYLNGELAEEQSGVAVSATVTKNVHIIGGDFRSGNPYVFKGKISSMAFYRDIRVSSEVVADMQSVETTDENLLAAYDFNGIETGDTTVEDLSKKNFHLLIEPVWLDADEVAAPENYSYSFAVVGDTQYIVRDNPDKLSVIYDWILENKENRKISYVMGLGDIVEHLYMSEGNLAVEWQLAREAIGKLDGNIPYSLIRGNHDDSKFLNETFGTDVYMSGVDGTYDGKIENSYRTFTVGSHKYMVLTLDFEPTDEEIAWANQVVAANSDCRVIVNTHSYLHHDGSYTSSEYGGSEAVGQKIWDDFASQHKNIMMVLCGHVPYDPIVYRQDEGVNGNTVTQMLIDPQDIDGHNTPTGLVAMFYFSEDGETLTVQYYSTVRNQYFGKGNQFTIDLGDYSGIGEVSSDTEKPKISVINPQMGVAGTSYSLPQIIVNDNFDGEITTSYIVYKKGDENKTPLTVTNGAFTPMEGGYYVLCVTATDEAGNVTTVEKDLPIRATALSSGVLEDFASEVTAVNFTGGAESEWLASHEGASGVLHLFPNQTDKSYYWFRLFEEMGDYGLAFNSISLRVWVDAEDTNGAKVSTSFYDTYEGKWKGFGNSTTNGWQTVTFTDFYDWEYFSESMKTSRGGQLFWSWTKNSHIYIDEITFNASKTPVVELDKTEYAKGDTVQINAYLAEDPTRKVLIGVTDPNGDEVTVTDGAFVMTVAGEYTITAAIVSPSHYAGATTVKVEALVEHIVVDKYTDKIPSGTQITVPNASVYDPIAKSEMADVAVTASVTYGGESITVTDGKFTATQTGVYTVTYQATLADGTALEEVIKLYVSDYLVEFAPSEVDCLVGEGEWLEEYEGATGVMKATYSTDTYQGFLFKVNQTKAELQALDWDYIEIKVWVGGSGSNPDPVYQVGDPYRYLGSFVRNAWGKIRLSKEQITAVSGMDYFYNNITGGGIELFWSWNTTSQDWYFDYIAFKSNSVPVDFDDETSLKQVVLNNANQTKTWVKNFEGASGVVKIEPNGSTSTLYFKFAMTADELAAENWDSLEIRMYVTKDMWTIYNQNAGIGSIPTGEWATLTLTKTVIASADGTYPNNIDGWCSAVVGGNGAPFFWSWGMETSGQAIYIDYIRLVSSV